MMINCNVCLMSFASRQSYDAITNQCVDIITPNAANPTNDNSLDAVEKLQGVLQTIQTHHDLTKPEKQTLNTWVLGLISDIAQSFGQRNNLGENYGTPPEHLG